MSTFTDVVHRKAEWRGYPGLWDPFRVIEVCLGELSLDVFPNVRLRNLEYGSVDEKTRNSLCPGLQRYLEPWPEPDPKINDNVLDYILNPCNEKLKLYATKDKLTCLFFMLEYFRIRGPFITIKVDDSSIKRNQLSVRFLVPTVQAYMKSLPTLDYCAVTALGRYLTSMINVSYLHEKFFFPEVISRLYGPIFIGFDVAKDAADKLNANNQADVVCQLFSKILDAMPWSQIDPLSDASRCVFPSDERHMYKKNCLLGSYIVSSQGIPQEVETAMRSQSRSLETTENSTTVDPSRKQFETDKSFPPDTCSLICQQRERFCKI